MHCKKEQFVTKLHFLCFSSIPKIFQSVLFSRDLLQLISANFKIYIHLVKTLFQAFVLSAQSNIRKIRLIARHQTITTLQRITCRSFLHLEHEIQKQTYFLTLKSTKVRIHGDNSLNEASILRTGSTSLVLKNRKHAAVSINALVIYWFMTALN